MTRLPRLLMSLAWAILPANFALAGASIAVEYFHSGYGHYFLTSSSREMYALDSGNLPGWNRTGQSFGVFELGTAPSANVCRFWSGQTFARKSSHFYTPFDWECALTKGNRDWNFEGEVFAMLLPDAAGTCAGGTMPLYRLYNDGHGDAPNHRYTSSLAIRSDMMAKGWIPEGSGIGVSGCVQARPVAALSGITKIATGGNHTCALAAYGGIKCWGWNDFGQLGNATTLRQVTPVDVSGLATGMVAVATGERHTCALTASGGAKCWGENRWGQLGDGSTTDRLTPVDVSGLASGVAAIAPSGLHTCAVTASGGVKCWGAIWIGLPDGSRVQSLTPIDVPGLEGGIAAITAGGHVCALTAAGGVKCWGANEHGQLGDNSSNYRFSPVDVVGLASGVVAITGGGAHTCALTAIGGVKCWGWNNAGALGNGSTADSWIPVDVTGLASGVAAIAAGAEHTCANTRAGTVKCWGWNVGGQLGNNNAPYPPALTPVDVQGLPIGTTAVAAGGMHSCALDTANGVVCWGLDNFGQLGDNSIVERLTPVGVPGLASGVSAISGTYGRTCVVTASGGVKCWGGNYFTRLPDNSWGQPLTPVDVPELATGVTAIATGRAHACVLTTAGGVKCWGESFNSDGVTPMDVPGLASGVTSITAGDDHTCAIAPSGGVKCWGANEHGQLGDNSTSYRLSPVDVTGLASGVVAIGAGEASTCAVTAPGGAKCWGENRWGQLGDGSTTDRLIPGDVSGLASGVAAIAAGGGHTCAITTVGAAKCWGDNGYGQLGDNSTVGRLTPVDVSGLGSGVAAISAGKYFHTCAITTSGGAKCWGGNGYGMLGDNSTLQRSVPVDVAGLATGVTAISAGGHHTCALVGAGEVKCWGSNFSGELGDGGAGFRPYPVEVLTQPGGQ